MEPNNKFDLVGLGECLVELRREHPAHYTQSYAGDVFNSLYYASRLGLRTGFISQFGSDHFTGNLISLCRNERIDISLCKTSATRANGIYTILTDDPGQPSYSFWRAGSAATMTLAETPIEEIAEYIAQSKNFLFSAIGLSIFRETEKLFSLLQAVNKRARIYFDVNVRPSLWNNPEQLKLYIERLAPLVDTIFISSSDDRHLYGERAGKDCAEWLRNLGYGRIIYRNGAQPTLAWSNDTGYIEVPAMPNVEVIDATGAGDAFNSGFIAMQDSPFEEAVRFGNVCGAIAIGADGALAPDFSRHNVNRLYSSYQLSFSSGG